MCHAVFSEQRPSERGRWNFEIRAITGLEKVNEGFEICIGDSGSG